MAGILMPKEIMLSKVPFHLSDKFKEIFEKTEEKQKCGLTRYEILDDGITCTVIGYDKLGRSYTSSLRLDKFYRSDIDG